MSGHARRRQGTVGWTWIAFGLASIALEPACARAQLEEASELQTQVIQLQQEKRYEEAIPVAQRILAIVEQAQGKEHADVATAATFVALLYESIRAYPEAEPLHRRSLAIKEKTLGPDHPEVAIALSQLAHVYSCTGDFDRAEPLYRRALAIQEKALGAEDPEVATTLNSLARLYDSRADYARAEPLYERALAIREKKLGPGHPEVATVLSNLAALRYSLGDYQNAEPIYARALAIDEQSLGSDHVDVATILANLAVLYLKLGDYERAERLNQQALAIRERAFGPVHAAVAAILSSLAALYEARGEYARAEPILRRALAINEKTLGSNHPEVASVLNNLAMLYQSLGDSIEAERLHRRALAIRQTAFGPHHPDVAASYNNLAMLYESRGDYGSAEPLYRSASEIYDRTLGANHPDAEAVMANISGLLLNQGRLDAAFEILKRGDWPTGLGRYYLLKRDYYEAHARLVRAVAGARKSGESRHLLAGHIGLGLALEGIGEPAEAAKNYRAAVELIEDQRAALGPSARTNFLSGRVGAGFQRIAAYDGLVRTSIKLGDPNEAMRWSEHTKARLLLDATGRGAAPGLPPDLVQEEERLTARLGALLRQRDATFTINPELFKTLEAERIPQAERSLGAFVDEIRRRYPAYAAYKYPQPLGPSEIALRPREVVLVYAVTENETFAWLVRDRRVVKLAAIPIGREALVRRIREYRSLFEGIRHTSDLRSDVEQGRNLYDLLARDLVASCAPGDTLTIVPDAGLALIPFEALVAEGPDGSGAEKKDARYLGDLFPVQYAHSATVLSNARTLAPKDTQDDEDTILVLADPVFDSADSRWPSDAAGQPPAEGYSAQRRRAVAEDTTGMPSLPRLTRTAELVDNLEDGFGSAQVDALVGIDASERSLRGKRLADYRYLVFATHGALGGQLRYLQEPALVLSQVGVRSAEAVNDGYLTLSEVSELELNAEVAALTACQTGVGKELDGEGVMGMGWAFEHAGARNVLMSLWSVDQKSTVKLIESFFAHLREGVRPQEALRRARAELRQSGYAHPFFWAPFILAGEG
jgi:tetratricopeptide (TPR) repeat protein